MPAAGWLAQSVPAAAGNESIEALLIGLVATSIAALVYTIRSNTNAKAAAREAGEANAAVNHTVFGERRLYEIVTSIEAKQDDFDRKWGNLPAGMGDAVELAQLLHDLDQRIGSIQTELLNHIAWEAAKYNEGEHP